MLDDGPTAPAKVARVRSGGGHTWFELTIHEGKHFVQMDGKEVFRFATRVMGRAVQHIIDKGKRIASHLLEAAQSDIDFAGGRFVVKGTDRSVGLFETAAAAAAVVMCSTTSLSPGKRAVSGARMRSTNTRSPATSRGIEAGCT